MPIMALNINSLEALLPVIMTSPALTAIPSASFFPPWLPTFLFNSFHPSGNSFAAPLDPHQHLY